MTPEQREMRLKAASFHEAMPAETGIEIIVREEFNLKTDHTIHLYANGEHVFIDYIDEKIVCSLGDHWQTPDKLDTVIALLQKAREIMGGG